MSTDIRKKTTSLFNKTTASEDNGKAPETTDKTVATDENIAHEVVSPPPPAKPLTRKEEKKRNEESSGAEDELLSASIKVMLTKHEKERLLKYVGNQNSPYSDYSKFVRKAVAMVLDKEEKILAETEKAIERIRNKMG